MSHHEITLENLGNGAAVSKVQHEIQNALNNCLDPNTDTKIKRRVTLTIDLTPDAKREHVGIVFQASSKLAPDSAGEDHALLMRDKENGGAKGYVDTAEQLLIEDYENKVAEISKQQSEGGE